MSTVVSLENTAELTGGTQRRVFLHPHDSTKIIKVLRPMPLRKGRSWLASWAERNVPAFRHRWTRKEYGEYLRLMLRKDAGLKDPPIAHMYGFVRTSEGLGCMSDAVMEGDLLGPTLQDKIINRTLSPDDLALFNDSIQRLYYFDIRAGDMTARNFVFGHRNYGAGAGLRECVLVDGFGDIHAIPIRSAGRFLNRFGLDDGCTRLAKRTGLSWDKSTKLFSTAP